LEDGRIFTADSSDHRQQAADASFLETKASTTFNAGSGIASSLESMTIRICGLRRFISVCFLMTIHLGYVVIDDHAATEQFAAILKPYRAEAAVSTLYQRPSNSVFW
jgi:hypothetical protein